MASHLECVRERRAEDPGEPVGLLLSREWIGANPGLTAADLRATPPSVARLDAIMDPAEYDEDFHAPTPAAYRFTRSLLEAVGGHATPSLGPLGDGGLTTDRNCSPAPVGDGGIFVQWGPQGHYVRLLVPADPSQAYLYCRSSEQRRTCTANTETLLRELEVLRSR